MFPVTYEDVVRRDRPTYWWRLNRAPASNFLSSITSGPDPAFLNGSTSRLPLGAAGLPGAGSPVACNLNGDSGTNANNDGWWRNAFPFTQTTYVAFELWVYVRVPLTAGRVYSLMHRTNNSGTTVGMFISGAGKLRDVSSGTLDSVESLTVNAWNHCLINFDINGGSVLPTEVYLNGQRTVRVGASNAQSICSSALQFGIGRPDFNTIQAPPANLADAAVYNSRLTHGQVLDHYRAGLGVRRSPSRLASIMTPPGAAPPPPPPPPGGLTPITTALSNRRLAVVSDRPR
jgi:hypothetical protein